MPLTRWSRRHKKTFGKYDEEVWDGNFRQPPKPKSYYTKVKGQCRWCDKIIVKEDGSINVRKNWHQDCVNEYMFIYHSKETRAIVYKRDSGICAWCDSLSHRWHADHIKPLVEQKGKSVKELDYTYWGMDNLQTLCSNCHRMKTSDEAHNRAKDRKNKDKVKWKSFREVFGV